MKNTKGCVYKHTCTISGKSYIGQTINGIKKRWTGHKALAKSKAQPSNHFHNAIRKYGTNAFKHIVLEDNIDLHLLNDKEAYYILKYNTYKEGYNSSPRNDNGIVHSEETKDKMKQLYKNRSETNKKEIANKISKAVSGSKNHKFKPWWYQIKGKEKVTVSNYSLREYAILKNVSAGTLKFRFSTKNKGKYTKRGVFKDVAFGYVK